MEKYNVIETRNGYCVEPGIGGFGDNRTLATVVCQSCNIAYAQGREDQKKDDEVEFAGAAEIRDAAAELVKARGEAYKHGQDAAMKDINLLLHREKQLSYNAGYSTGRKEGLAETDLREIVNGLPSGDSDPLAAAYRRGRDDQMREIRIEPEIKETARWRAGFEAGHRDARIEQAAATLKAQLEAHDLGYQQAKNEARSVVGSGQSIYDQGFESGKQQAQKEFAETIKPVIPPLPPAFAELLKKRPAPWTSDVFDGREAIYDGTADFSLARIVAHIDGGTIKPWPKIGNLAEILIGLVNWAAALPQGEKAVEEPEPIEVTWWEWLKIAEGLKVGCPNLVDPDQLIAVGDMRFKIKPQKHPGDWSQSPAPAPSERAEP